MMMETSNNLFLNELELIQKIIHGEKSLFEILVRRTNSALYKIGRLYGFNHQETEDLMQESHITAFLKLSTFEGRSSYKTWISKIMVHHCIYRTKYGYNKYEKPDSDQIHENLQPMHSANKNLSTESMINRQEFSTLLENTLQNIPVHYRLVFVLRDIEGYSVEETATLLNITSVNVKVRLSRARAIIQKELEKIYSRTEIYPFHLSFCDPLTRKVMECISKINVE